MTIERRQVLVIGSGPGGAVTAATLSEAGFAVLALEEVASVKWGDVLAFYLAKMETAYRSAGMTIVFGRRPIAHREACCVVGGSEVISGLYHRRLAEYKLTFALYIVRNDQHFGNTFLNLRGDSSDDSRYLGSASAAYSSRMEHAERELRIALVGFGLIGRQRAKAIESLGMVLPVRLTSIIDPVFAHEPESDARRVASWDQVPKGSFDVALIAVPHHLTLETIKTAIAWGAKAILVEKPLGLTIEQAKEARSLLNKTAMPSYVGFNYRFLPHVSRLLDDIVCGRLGTLRSVELVLGHGGAPNDRESWKLDPTRGGSGVLSDPGVHLFDLASQIVPDLEVVFARATSDFWGTGMPEDGYCALLAHDVVVTIRSSIVRWRNEFSVSAYGNDAYAIATGRGGHYGEMTYRYGKRWGWMTGSTQEESEDVQDSSQDEGPFADETKTAILNWLSQETTPQSSRLATPDQALRSTELAETASALAATFS